MPKKKKTRTRSAARKKKTSRKPSNGRRKKTGTRSRKKVMRRKRSSRGISSYSTEELVQEMQRREQEAAELQSRRDDLQAELEELDDHLSKLKGIQRSRQARRRGRPRGSAQQGSLVETLARVMANKTLSVADAVEAVLDRGYRTTSGNFRVIVNQALTANPDKFKKIARGQYTAR